MEITLMYYGLKIELDISKLMVLRQPGWWMGVYPVIHEDRSFICNLHFDVTSFRNHPLVHRENDLNLPLADTTVTIGESLVWPDYFPVVLSQFLDKQIEFSSSSVEQEWGRPISGINDDGIRASILLGHQQDGLPILFGARLRDLFVIHHLMHLTLTGDVCSSASETRIQRSKSSAILICEKSLSHYFVTLYFDLHVDEGLLDPIEGDIFGECCLYGLRGGFLSVEALHEALDSLQLSHEARWSLKRGLDVAERELKFNPNKV